MDEIVEAALRKWPNVPHCHGWLALDARGDWYMRDERAQLAGPFPQVKGSRIRHDKLLGFIHRNYGRDTGGSWYFQNGPQRVYVELEAAPWIWRFHQGLVRSHTGLHARVAEARVDEQGRLFLATDLGLGLVHSLDMDEASDELVAQAWPLHEARFADLPHQFGYVLKPAP